MQLIIQAIFALTFLLSYLPQRPAPGKLAGTAWSGTVMAPGAYEAILEFRNDTLYVRVNNNIIETSSYQEKGDTLVFKKLSGRSPCSEETGKYTYELKDNVLKISAFEDACSARANAFSTEGYRKHTAK